MPCPEAPPPGQLSFMGACANVVQLIQSCRPFTGWFSQTTKGETMKQLLAIAFAAMFATVSVAPVFAAEKKEAAKVDCKDAKNKDHKDCKAKK